MVHRVGTCPESLVVSRKTHGPSHECVYQENTSDRWDIPWYNTRERCITILYHAMENTVANTIDICDKHAAHDGKVGCNTVECTLTSSILIGCNVWLDIKHGLF